MSEWMRRLASQATAKPPGKQTIIVEKIPRNVDDYVTGLRGNDRIAFLSLFELVSQGKADFLFLKEPDIMKFWEKHVRKIERIYQKD